MYRNLTRVKESDIVVGSLLYSKHWSTISGLKVDSFMLITEILDELDVKVLASYTGKIHTLTNDHLLFSGICFSVKESAD